MRRDQQARQVGAETGESGVAPPRLAEVLRHAFMDAARAGVWRVEHRDRATNNIRVRPSAISRVHRCVAHMVRNVLVENKDQLLAGMIVAGWDAADRSCSRSTGALDPRTFSPTAMPRTATACSVLKRSGLSRVRLFVRLVTVDRDGAV
jgi:hypothetical protein